MSPKKQRSPNDRFDPNAMQAKLAPFANMKQATWDWEFVKYGQSKRGYGPDRASLEIYEPILAVVLMMCPGALPALTLLRSVWLALEHDYGIRSPHPKFGETVFSWASDACTQLRVILGHIRDIRLSGTKFVAGAARRLAEMVVISDENPNVPMFGPALALADVPSAPKQKATVAAQAIIRCKCGHLWHRMQLP